MSTSTPGIVPPAPPAPPDEVRVPAALAEYEVLPASFAQERLWLVQQFEGAEAAYHLFRAFRVDGPLVPAALERAFAEVVRRHEALRTTFREENGAPVQVIALFRGFTVPVEDLSGAAGEDVARRLAEEAARPFDLRAGPLFRAGVLRLAADAHVLWIAMHHLVGDGWSMEVLYRELAALYAAHAGGGEAHLPELPVQYADFALWQREQLRGEVLERQLAYWRERLAGAPALLELPADHPRPPVQSYRGATERFALPGGVRERLEALGRAEGATAFMVLLAAFQVLLAKYGGADVVVGTPVAGRTRREVEGLIGFFANLLVLRTDLSGDPGFREVVRRVRAAAEGAYEHQELPFELLVAELQPERTLSHAPLVQVVFAVEGAALPAGGWGGLRLRPVEVERDTAKFDLSLTLSAEGGELRGAWSYSTDLFDRATLRRMSGHLARVMEQAADDPSRPLSRLALMDEAERRRVVEEWNRTEAAYPAEWCIHPLFEAQAEATPHAVAVVSGDEALTYRELNERANRLAHHLAGLGVGPEVRVGVCLERGPEMVAALLAILKAGGAYVPLDPAYPAGRLAFMLDDAGVAVLLTQESLRASLPAAPGVVRVSVDGDRDRIAAARAEAPRVEAGPGGLAYVVYTSGSTGTPKGVAVEHRSVVRLVRGANYVSLGPEEVVLQAAPVSFDAATLELWGALLNGGRLVLAPGAAPSLEQLGDAIVRHGVTTLWLTAGLFQAMVQERLEALRGVRQLLAGGDVLPADAVARVRARFPALRLINGYGPTENTTFTCCHTVDAAWSGGPVPIGTPISNTRVYVLDAALQPVPAGVPGELFAGGDGVARGYLGRPGLTAERFVPDALSGVPGARLYRTGDRVRWRAETGVLEYLGRLDHQVKVRGFRVEPGEVEAALRRHPGVRDCAVLVREDAPGERWLAAYVAGEADAEALRAHLRRSLPEYMVPSAFVSLEALPLSPNGKLDRGALPAPELAAAEAYVAPRTPVEEVLAGIWAELLRRERVGTAESFFDLGGHSLLAMSAVSRIREVLAVELPLRAFFEDPTVAELAARVEALRRAGRPPLPPVVPVERTAALPLSFAQERLWFLDRLEPGSPLYNLPAAFRLSGELDAGALERTLGGLVRRHEALRTVFREVDGVPVQVIAPAAPFPLPLEALSGEDDAGVQRRIDEEAVRPFDLAAGPLFRARLLRVADDDHLLLLCMHHAVSDGWSLGVLFRELSALYEAARSGEESPLPPLPVQYADYAVWQREQLRGPVLEGELAWWRERLAGASALLELPLDHPRPAVESHRGAEEVLELPPERVARLRALGRGEGATLYMVLLAAFQLLLAKYAGTGDVVVASPVAGRTRREVEGLIGFFANTLALRADLSGDPGFREAVRRARGAALEAWEHQEAPFEAVVEALNPERSLSHAPLAQVMFALAGGGEAADALPSLPGLGARAVEARTGRVKFDLALSFAPHAGGAPGRLSYATDLFDRATIRRMCGHLASVLAQVADDPSLPLSRLALMDGAERRRVLEEWNRTAAPYPADRCVHQLFEAQAEATPRAVAVVCGDQALPYHELNERANRLARHLARLGVGPEARVGVGVRRGVEMLAALLAVLKAGGAYVPLDPAYPAGRLAFTLADAGVAVLLTEEALRGSLPVPEGVRVVSVDGADAVAIARESGANPPAAAGPRNLAYLIYTSGSTGVPKGVAIEHGSTVALLHWAAGIHPAEELGGMLACTSICFDLSVYELFLPLSRGGRVIVVENALALPAAPAAGEVRLLNTVPSAAAALLKIGGIPAGVATVNLAGEPLRAELVDALYAQGVQRVYDLYGPSEDTTYSTWTLRRAGGPVTIGRPLANRRAYVLDAALQPVPVGIPGELCLGGRGLARGYLGRPSLTAEKFVPDPFSGEPGGRLYRTGDRARWRETASTGVLEYLGRLDHQVKVRGYRIEPGEIETVLRRHSAVRDCAVLAREDAPGERRLAAYVVGGADAETLRAHLRRTLPEYMVPSAIIPLEALPLTPNGKLDRKALPAPELAAAEDAYEAPRTPVEEVLAGIWAELLRRERVGVAESFFDLGGHSLLAVRVVSRIREALSAELPLRALFEAPTVGELAGRVEEVRRAGRAPLPPVVPVERTAALPLSFAQERLWFLDRLEPGSALYNLPAALRLSGEVDAGALERALGELVRRHEALRTVFREMDGVPVQVIVPAAGAALAVEDAAGVDDAELRRRIAAEAARPFDLAAGPLFRARLLRVADDDHVLLLCMHHAVSDGWSLGVLFRELSALYEAYAKGEESPLPPLPVQYADYAVWQREQLRGPVLEGELAWWRERLAGAPALLELPLDHLRPAVQSHRGAEEWLELPPERVARLRALGRSEGATLYMVLLAAFQLLLAKYAGTDDVVVGSPVAGRTRREVEGLIGFFANTLVLRTDLSGDPDFREAVRRARGVALEAWEHQEVPFERLVAELQPERSLSHAPLFQATFVLAEDTDAADGLGGAAAEALEVELGSSKYDLALHLSAGGRATLSYATDLFERATARRMLAHLAWVLAQVADDPATPLSRLALMDDAERRTVLEAWNRTDAPPLDGRCIHHLFAEQAARTPDAEALRFGGLSTTYRELDEASSRLAHHLAARGVRPESRVGVLAERAPGTVTAILAILKAGGAYVPLDPAYPAERLRYMLRDCGARLVVAPAGVPEALARELALADLLDPRAEAGAIAARPATPPAAAVDPDGLAYVIYTSGSTGRPKGVMVTHRGIPPFVRAGSARVGLDASARVLQFASFSFDAAVWETFATLARGATLVMAPREELLPGPALAGTLRRERISLVVLPPSVLALLEPDDLPELRTVLSAGEALTPELVERWSAGRTLVNAYGPTEATVCPCMELCRADGGTPPIGRPLGRARLYVLDAAGEPVPAGVAGELHVGGAGVARGYLGRPGLTAERFVPDPFGPAGALLYRTGDRARWRADGTLLFAGRVDGQVKIRGYRVEPGEIEAVLRRHAGVSDCVVVLREELPGGPRLVAYVVGEADGDALRPHLRGALPEYMVPGAFVRLDALPRMPGGKPDRRALPAPPTGGAAHRLRPGTALEARIAALWQELLGVDGVGVEDNFFDLGGHSLLLVRLQARLAAELGREVPVADLFQHPTVRSLAARLQGEAEEGAAEEGEERGGARQAAAERMRARRRRAGGGEGLR